MANQKQVAFNHEQYHLWEDFYLKGLTSKPFATFVRDAFYDKLDSINIEKITQQQIENLTAKSR